MDYMLSTDMLLSMSIKEFRTISLLRKPRIILSQHISIHLWWKDLDLSDSVETISCVKWRRMKPLKYSMAILLTILIPLVILEDRPIKKKKLRRISLAFLFASILRLLLLKPFLSLRVSPFPTKKRPESYHQRKC